GLDTARVTGSVTVASQNLSRQTLVLHLEGGALRQPKPGAEFDLWVLQKGPRVFGIHEFTGDRMVWLALEDRLLIRDELWGWVGVVARAAAAQESERIEQRRPKTTSRPDPAAHAATMGGEGRGGRGVTIDWVGWLATALFVGSYFCRQQVTLRRVQGVAALVWM